MHIVCLDAPAPADYGGAIDMYYKIKALAESGRKIILHYFDYKKDRNVAGLEKYCHKIFAYKRKNLFSSLSTPLPYIVGSRVSQELIMRLNEDQHPILLEGFHCSGILPFIKKQGRTVAIRVHNNEAAYYQQLKNSETNTLRKYYFGWESKRLETYQNNIDRNVQLACISEDDHQYFLQRGFARSFFLPAFLPWQQINSKTGTGKYCLYHGNLSVAENVKAVEWLAEKVFAGQTIPLIIAGKNLPAATKQKLSGWTNISLVNNPTNEEMERLIADAHIHVLPSFNTTGVKLKLLHAAFAGRFCITNNAGAVGSSIQAEMIVAETEADFIEQIKKHLALPFIENDKARRRTILKKYDNALNAEMLSASLL